MVLYVYVSTKMKTVVDIDVFVFMPFNAFCAQLIMQVLYC